MAYGQFVSTGTGEPYWDNYQWVSPFFYKTQPT